MGWYCYTLISCSANLGNAEADPSLAELARKHIERLKAADGGHISLRFLDHVAEGRAYACSHKGAAISFAAVGNYVNIDTTVEELMPFFDDLWADGHLLDFDHVIVMVNQEQALKTEIREIVHSSHAVDSECTAPEWAGKRVRSYTAPWSWHQM